ncbi:hypothetical protein SAMN05216228_11442 [Rhizobium tibeticum]|uniref:Uncharacterized protein n=1 Tax=Rhizobium tibeticum TaxID=501024 RepID=A0ABY1AZ83_9HYPH|nr:hypothetical protein SAMN05216228_11442 [Rhizobium tibeticum]
MNEGKTKEQDSGVELEFDLGDPPQKVWRAVTIPELRERPSPPARQFATSCVTITRLSLKAP